VWHRIELGVSACLDLGPDDPGHQDVGSRRNGPQQRKGESENCGDHGGHDRDLDGLEELSEDVGKKTEGLSRRNHVGREPHQRLGERLQAIKKIEVGDERGEDAQRQDEEKDKGELGAPTTKQLVRRACLW